MNSFSDIFFLEHLNFPMELSSKRLVLNQRTSKNTKILLGCAHRAERLFLTHRCKSFQRFREAPPSEFQFQFLSEPNHSSANYLSSHRNHRVGMALLETNFHDHCLYHSTLFVRTLKCNGLL